MTFIRHASWALMVGVCAVLVETAEPSQSKELHPYNWERAWKAHPVATYVAENEICVSTCAYIWLRGQQKRNDGVLCWHTPYRARTKKPDDIIIFRLAAFLYDVDVNWMLPVLIEKTDFDTYLCLQNDQWWIGTSKHMKGRRITDPTVQPSKLPTGGFASAKGPLPRY